MQNFTESWKTFLEVLALLLAAALLSFGFSYWLIEMEVSDDLDDFILSVENQLDTAYQDLRVMDALSFEQCDEKGQEVLKEHMFNSIYANLFFVRSLSSPPFEFCSVMGQVSFDLSINTKPKLWEIPALENTKLTSSYLPGQSYQDLYMWHQGRQVNIRRISLLSHYSFFEPERHSDRRIYIHLGDNELVLDIGSLDGDGIKSIQIKSDKYPIEVTSVIGLWRVFSLSKTYFLPFLLLLSTFILLMFHSYRLRKELHKSIHFRLAKAIDNGQLQPFYQPIMNARTGEIVGAEALIRWILPSGEILSPAIFINELEQSDMVYQVTTKILNDIPQDLAVVLNANPEFRCGINLIAAQIETAKFSNLLAQLSEFGYPAYHLALEITERSPIQDMTVASANLKQLQELGCLIELDDAGTGYGGGQYVQQLPFNIMKIDKLFIDTLVEEENRTQVLDAYVGMAKSLNMGVIAEGVETLAQSQALLSRGVCLQQGYLFAKPMAAKDFVEFWQQTQQAKLTLNTEH
ncbi:MAG: EAL domain-containing protein [Shewanella sp.]